MKKNNLIFILTTIFLIGPIVFSVSTNCPIIQNTFDCNDIGNSTCVGTLTANNQCFFYQKNPVTNLCEQVNVFCYNNTEDFYGTNLSFKDTYLYKSFDISNIMGPLTKTNQSSCKSSGSTSVKFTDSKYCYYVRQDNNQTHYLKNDLIQTPIGVTTTYDCSSINSYKTCNFLDTNNFETCSYSDYLFKYKESQICNQFLDDWDNTCVFIEGVNCNPCNSTNWYPSYLTNNCFDCSVDVNFLQKNSCNTTRLFNPSEQWETPSEFCSRLGKECGAQTSYDNYCCEEVTHYCGDCEEGLTCDNGECKTAIDGICGTGNENISLTEVKYGLDNDDYRRIRENLELCSQGNITSLSYDYLPDLEHRVVTWSCLGTDGGETANCAATLEVPDNFLLLEGPFSGEGTGTYNDPFRITNCKQLQEINKTNYYNGDYYWVLNNDIDCNETKEWVSLIKKFAPDYTKFYALEKVGFHPIGNAYNDDWFSGFFDGNGHTINNLFMSYGGVKFGGLIEGGVQDLFYPEQNMHSEYMTTDVALFREGITAKSVLKNFIIENAFLSLSDSSAGIVTNNNGTISNVKIKDSFLRSTFALGGIAAYNNPTGIIEHVTVDNSIIYCDGIAGGVTSDNTGLIKNSEVVNVIITSNARDYAGGISGAQNQYNVLETVSLIDGCVAYGVRINGKYYSNGITFGGIVGYNNGRISNSKSLQNNFDVNNHEESFSMNIGGLIGANSSNGEVNGSCAVNAQIDYNSYYADGRYIAIGGFTGSNSGKIANSYSEIELLVTSGDIGGFIGSDMNGYTSNNLVKGHITIKPELFSFPEEEISDKNFPYYYSWFPRVGGFTGMQFETNYIRNNISTTSISIDYENPYCYSSTSDENYAACSGDAKTPALHGSLLFSNFIGKIYFETQEPIMQSNYGFGNISKTTNVPTNRFYNGNFIGLMFGLTDNNKYLSPNYSILGEPFIARCYETIVENYAFNEESDCDANTLKPIITNQNYFEDDCAAWDMIPTNPDENYYIKTYYIGETCKNHSNGQPEYSFYGAEIDQWFIPVITPGGFKFTTNNYPIPKASAHCVTDTTITLKCGAKTNSPKPIGAVMCEETYRPYENSKLFNHYKPIGASMSNVGEFETKYPNTSPNQTINLADYYTIDLVNGFDINGRLFLLNPFWDENTLVSVYYYLGGGYNWTLVESKEDCNMLIPCDYYISENGCKDNDDSCEQHNDCCSGYCINEICKSEPTCKSENEYCSNECITEESVNWCPNLCCPGLDCINNECKIIENPNCLDDDEICGEDCTPLNDNDCLTPLNNIENFELKIEGDELFAYAKCTYSVRADLNLLIGEQLINKEIFCLENLEKNLIINLNEIQDFNESNYKGTMKIPSPCNICQRETLIFLTKNKTDQNIIPDNNIIIISIITIFCLIILNHKKND